MSKNLLIVGALAVLGIIGVVFFISQDSANNDAVMLEDSKPDESAMEGEDLDEEDAMMVDNELGDSRYVEFEEKLFEQSKDKKRVYFFHASWCPTCKVANEEFSSNENNIPEGVVLFKTDYDTSTALKKKYAITYQHTFVQVDEDGEEIAKWNGGGIAELSKNIK